MNKRKLFLLMLFAFFTASADASDQNQTITFSIKNMTCKMCNITVRKAIEKVEGVISVKVDYDSKTAQVTFIPNATSVLQVEEASTMAGYPTSVKQE